MNFSTLRAETEHLTVAVNALVGAASVIEVTSITALASMSVICQGGTRPTGTFIASLGVRTHILAGAVPVVEGALVVVDALQAVLGQSVA